MRDPIRSGHAAHLKGYLPGLGTVVNLGQDMGVNVEHELVSILEQIPAPLFLAREQVAEILLAIGAYSLLSS